MYWICSSVFILLALSRWTSADCVSYGVDYVDGGGPYCINTTSTDFFSFVSDFEGCQPSDSQGDITPILIDPNGDEYFCSDVATQPDDVDMTSTCNVTGNQVEKSQMFSGNWMIIVEGLTFAYMRTFDIIAGPPVTVTNTPTATFTVTNVPSTTITTTTTNVYSTTLPPSTVTVPSSTSTRTITTTPAQVTVYWTSTSTRTRTTRVWSSTVSTTTVTTTCKTQPPKKDPTCTIRPTKATLAAASNTANPVPRQRFRGAPRRDRPRDVSKHTLIEPRDGQLFKRGADVCTTTVLQTTNVVSSYVTVTAPTSTEIDTEVATVTATVTPAPVTAYSGVVKTTTTVTAPTPTRTRTSRAYVTTWTTSTIWATITSTVKTTPSGMVCATVAAR
ncbi:hypothetical protein LTR99_005259 [Exophiala xenobiotica]|uniref:Uncharacterized protein n=1 Tax=Vermiconidia calcicola TaxID=1690605 RepID=A0AAV9Q9Y2_9PEZI|nr:hypothetical protein LTR92_004016 [Exophiala xenobiotica]KAK5535983.1 hypothetical protein LTR25_005885 [Vermiconidia calcicola]KAK5214114.1 hypothetical protein LTR41_000306 [Exophiala xenobiotica]KAK5227128.1 hypothetical protein LTR72_003118 [Exophiala xenobiotica]KAK5230715.1 hypothetical protein LTR47_007270 [Exophiala xenobiotica]